MATPVELYSEGVRKKFGNYFAAWLPDQRFRLGDVGILKKDVFTRVTSLKSLDIGFKERPAEASAPIDFVSEAGVAIIFKAAGETNTSLANIPEAKAGVGIDFERQGAFIVRAPESFSSSIEDIATLQSQILDAYKKGKWHLNWAAIVRLVTTPTATIMISNSSQSKIELAVDGTASGGQIDLGNAKLNFEVRMKKGDMYNSIGSKDITPFFQLARIKSGMWPFPSSVVLSSGLSDITALDIATPDMAQNNQEISQSLYLDLIEGDDVEYKN